MEEQQKKDVAVFRFGVISDFVTRGRMDRGEQERLVVDDRGPGEGEDAGGAAG